jgi:hypothetical protein
LLKNVSICSGSLVIWRVTSSIVHSLNKHKTFGAYGFEFELPRTYAAAKTIGRGYFRHWPRNVFLQPPQRNC